MAIVDSLRARTANPKKKLKVIPLFHKVYRLVWDHPFVLVTLTFLICLQQYFPSIFSFFVSFSPVLVCALVLLGAILVHGHRVGEYRGELSNTVSSVRRGVPDYESLNRDYGATNSRIEMQPVRSKLSSVHSDDDSDYKYIDADEVEIPRELDSRGIWVDSDVAALPEKPGNNVEEKTWIESEVAWTEDDRPKNVLVPTSPEMKKDKPEENEEEEEGVSEDVEDDEEEDEEEEEEENLQEDEESKGITKWTEYDETNLRALGKSDLERNLRLENLLARRKERRNLSMIPEMNLIDLNFSDIPYQIAPILTTRNKINPFDDHTSSQHPQIPSSAPSITVTRRNPFDSPTHSPKNDPKNPVFDNLNVSSHGPELLEVINPKENVFRRYDSFSSTYDIVDKQDNAAVFRRHESFSERTAFSSICTQKRPSRFHLRPVFIPEHITREEEEDAESDVDGSVCSLSESELSESESESEHSEAILENDDPTHSENASNTTMPSEKASLDESDVKCTNAEEDEVIHVEPVYDRSPSALDTNEFVSSSTFSSSTLEMEK